MLSKPCPCAEDLPCACEGCQEKEALVRLLFARIDELEKALKVSAEINTRGTRH